METLIRAHGPGVHCYLPFRSYTNGIVRELSKLQDLCKNTILKYITLRRLLQKVQHLHLPTYLKRYLTTLTTADFEEIECAPFIDAFSLNFFHRALTYRVFCSLDQQEYMATHGYSHTEEALIESFHRSWIELQHDNIMCVCALVLDPVTNNIFYLFDQPKVSLVQICSILGEKNLPFPEVLLWQLVIDLTSALRYILSRRLRYGTFGLDNVFVVKGRVVLENGLTRKAWRSWTVSTQFTKPTFYDTDDPENEALVCLKNLTRNVIAEDCIFHYSKSMREFLKDENNLTSLDHIIEIGKLSLTGMENSFSFSELVDSLQHSMNEENNAT